MKFIALLTLFCVGASAQISPFRSVGFVGTLESGPVLETVATPTFSPDGGNYPTNVTVASTTSGATLVWTTNAWTATNYNTTPWVITNMGAGYVSAYATNAGMVNSLTVTSVVYAVPATCPTTGSPDIVQDGVSFSGSISYRGQAHWEDTEARTICKTRFKLTKVGDVSGQTYYCTIWSMSGESLSSQLATSQGVAGDNSWSQTWVVFEFDTPYGMAADTEYAIVVGRASGAYDHSNYAYVYFNGSGSITGHFNSWIGASGLGHDDPKDCAMELYWYD